MYQSIMLCRIGLVPNSNTNKLKRQYFIFCENIFVIFFVINIFNTHTVQNQLLYVLPLLLFLDGESVHEFDFPALALLASSSGMQSYLYIFKPFERIRHTKNHRSEQTDWNRVHTKNRGSESADWSRRTCTSRMNRQEGDSLLRILF